MGFEAPLALLALAAAALPVALHLLRRQDLPRRALPTVALLRRAEAASRKRVRLVDLLLLLVRVALLALAAMAIARPFLRVSLAYGDGSVASVVLVVDDSMSMTRAHGSDTLLAAAVERAGEIVGSLPEGSEVALVLAGAPARLEVARTDRLDLVRRALAERVRGGARGTDLAGAIALADRELSGAAHADRRLVIVTDAAAHGGLGDLRLPRGVAVHVDRVGEDAATANAAVVDARAVPDPTTPGRVSIAVEVRAREMDGRDIDVVLTRGEDELARQSVRIAEGGARATLHAGIDPADPAARVAIEVEDPLPLDDARGLLLRAPAGARVLLVEGDPPPGSTGGSRFLTRALDLAPDDGGALVRRRVDPETFAALEPSDADVVVLSNVPAPSSRVARRLREHVERGGGLLVAPGESFDPRAYVARLGALLPARPTPARDEDLGGPRPTAGNDLLPTTGSGLEMTRTRRRIGLEEIDPEARALLAFEDGSPALLVARRGDGQVALLATTLDDAWTDLPFRPGYLPLTVSLLRRLAPTGSTPQSAVLPGTPVALDPPAGALRVEVLGPDGERRVFDADAARSRIEVTDTEVAGVYRVQIATRERPLSEDPRLAFVVAPPAEESDLTPGDLPELARAPDAASAGGGVVQRPLAPWLFLFVGILAVVEAGLRLRAAHLSRRAA